MVKTLNKFIPHNIRRIIRNLKFAGNNVFCVLCEKSFITFLPFGTNGLRANAMCPNCLSLERTRIYWHFLKASKLLSNRKIKLLHVAPENALFKKISEQQNIEYYPVDKFEPNYKYLKGTQYMDITEIEYENEFFDLIICSHVLEHIEDDDKALSELFRVLKKGGKGLIMVPIDTKRTVTYEDNTITKPEERLIAFGQRDHVRIYGLDYADKLKSIGFDVKMDQTYNDLHYAEKFRFGFGNGQTLYISEK